MFQINTCVPKTKDESVLFFCKKASKFLRGLAAKRHKPKILEFGELCCTDFELDFVLSAIP